MVLLLQELELQTLTFLLMISLTLNAFLTGIQIQTILGNLITQKLLETQSTTFLSIKRIYLLSSQTLQTVGTTIVLHQIMSVENCSTAHPTSP